MSRRIIRAADCPPQPWKNGLGTTREIARSPADAGADDFLWRVSVAEVDSAAPFSAFPGIDRSIVLLDGAGFDMRLDDAATHALRTPFEPFAFPGEAAVEVTLAGGATRDFNLMLRREQLRGGVTVLQIAGRHPLSAGCVLVYAARGRIVTTDGELQAGDAWLANGSAIKLDEGAVALLAHAQPPAADG